jgi:crossover junction endodeoxyribonuclease RuvC
MRILGIDPGTVVMGYGVVDSDGDSVVAITYGVVTCQDRGPMPDRLSRLFGGLVEIIKRYVPDVVAIETPFVGENAKSALAVGKAQGVAMLSAALSHLPVFEYSPATVKRHVADYGASTKAQMQEMVKLFLNLDEVPQPHDAADALAIAICHSREIRLNEIRAEAE